MHNLAFCLALLSLLTLFIILLFSSYYWLVYQAVHRINNNWKSNINKLKVLKSAGLPFDDTDKPIDHDKST